MGIATSKYDNIYVAACLTVSPMAQVVTILRYYLEKSMVEVRADQHLTTHSETWGQQ